MTKSPNTQKRSPKGDGRCIHCHPGPLKQSKRIYRRRERREIFWRIANDFSIQTTIC
jgi:hypothetical protein